MARSQTFYTAKVDGNPNWGVVGGRVKSDDCWPIAAIALGAVCLTIHAQENGWVGGALDPEIPYDEAALLMQAAHNGAHVVDRGSMPQVEVQGFLGSAVVDSAIGPRPILEARLQ